MKLVFVDRYKSDQERGLMRKVHKQVVEGQWCFVEVACEEGRTGHQRLQKEEGWLL